MMFFCEIALAELDVHIISADDVSNTRDDNGTRCNIVFASRVATRISIASSSAVTIGMDMFDSVPVFVIQSVCGEFAVLAKHLRCSKYVTAPG